MPDFLNPEDIISSLEIKPGMHIADFGAGSGFFTTLFGHAVGDTGKVTALDVQKDALESLKLKAKRDNLLNLNFGWADLELPRGSKLEDGSQDLVMIANLLFQAEDKHAILREATRVLRPGGMCAIIDWGDQDPPPGPLRHFRVSKQTIKETCERLGLTLYRDLEAGLYHYGILFKK